MNADMGTGYHNAIGVHIGMECKQNIGAEEARRLGEEVHHGGFFGAPPPEQEEAGGEGRLFQINPYNGLLQCIPGAHISVTLVYILKIENSLISRKVGKS